MGVPDPSFASRSGHRNKIPQAGSEITDVISRSSEAGAGVVQLSPPGSNRRLQKVTDFQTFPKLILLINSLQSSFSQNLNLAPRCFQIPLPRFHPGSWLARKSLRP